MRRAGLALALALLLPAAARAQRAVTIRADNDAFNFWQYPWSRPDEEYSSGVRVSVALDGAAPWTRPVARFLGRCADGLAPCVSHSYELGQDIYTAARPKNAAIAPPGSRPDVGVLWLRGTTRLARETDLNELGWTVGITGNPSLAEQTQRLFHAIVPRYNRPITWGTTLPAEPVFSVQYDRRRMMFVRALEIEPHGGASLGTLLTEARFGVGARIGRVLQHPWRIGPVDKAFAFELTGDATLRAVARNEVLSGTFFRSSARMTLRPLVSELAGGVRVRWRGLDVSWIAHQTSAEYTARRAPHVWSTLELTWRPSR
jgi:hypothetical protein